MATNNNANAVMATTSSLGSAKEVHFLDAIVSQVARGLIPFTVDEIDAKTNVWLRRIGTDLDMDRSTIAQINPLTGFASFIHSWAREPFRLIRQPLNANQLLP